MQSRNEIVGTIYVVRAGNFVKIGYTTDLLKRLKALQTANSQELTVIATRSGTRRAERRIHNRLHAFHVRGEWFKDTPEMLAALKRELDAAVGIYGGTIDPWNTPKLRRHITKLLYGNEKPNESPSLQ